LLRKICPNRRKRNGGRNEQNHFLMDDWGKWCLAVAERRRKLAGDNVPGEREENNRVLKGRWKMMG
jgi:hypothetical protein